MENLIAKFIRGIIIVVSLLLFCILGTWYFFAFDIQWGLNWQAVTWGLPILVALVFVIIFIVKFIQQHKWRWGLSGISVAALALVYTASILIFYSYHIVGEPENGPMKTLDTEENLILSLVLSEFYGDSVGYVVVNPELSLEYTGLDLKERENIKELLRDNFLFIDEQSNTTIGFKDENFSRLIDRFLDINESPGPLTLKSSPEDGYYIDYDGKFLNYLYDGIGAGWLRIRLCRPGVALVDLSLPAYDPGTNLVLVYMGAVSDSLCGSGHIYLFRFKDEALEILGCVEVWIC